jgi:hypothetical protein
MSYFCGMREKSELQEKLVLLKPWIPEDLAGVLGRHFKVTADYVRKVWANERNAPAIVEATKLIIDDAEKAKVETFKQITASLN